jgi:hypothetical protein
MMTPDLIKRVIEALEEFTEWIANCENENATGEEILRERFNIYANARAALIVDAGGTNIDPAEWKSSDGRCGPGCGDCGAIADSADAWNRRYTMQSAPDEATVERVARALHKRRIASGLDEEKYWRSGPEELRMGYRDDARAALAAMGRGE